MAVSDSSPRSQLEPIFLSLSLSFVHLSPLWWPLWWPVAGIEIMFHHLHYHHHHHHHRYHRHHHHRTPPPPNTERVRASPFPRSFPGVVFACSAISFDQIFFSSPDSIDKRKGKSQDAITDRSHALFLLFFSLTRRKNARAPKLCMFICIYIYIYLRAKKNLEEINETVEAHAIRPRAGRGKGNQNDQLREGDRFLRTRLSIQRRPNVQTFPGQFFHRTAASLTHRHTDTPTYTHTHTHTQQGTLYERENPVTHTHTHTHSPSIQRASNLGTVAVPSIDCFPTWKIAHRFFPSTHTSNKKKNESR